MRRLAVVFACANALELAVIDPETLRTDGVVSSLGKIIFGVRDDAKHDTLCVAVDGLEESCQIRGDDGLFGELTVAAMGVGTHVLNVRVGDERASAILDVDPDDAAVDEDVDAGLLIESPADDLPPAHAAPRKLCVLTNTLEAHSQNSIFLAVSLHLRPRGWETEWFVPETEAGRREGVAETLRRGLIPVRLVCLSTTDFSKLRAERLAATRPSATRWAAENPSEARALAKCHVHYYANTFDDPSVASLSELAAALGRSGSVRIMELPNLFPPKDGAIDAFVVRLGMGVLGLRGARRRRA
ncbi:hypothetical protein M885DRAFT_228098 [Pelagophyceae sp. CCMP2097]|nr:hypothetical protein M885DRAFT_228098 [Pelagophyceae sp. CCMP2097]